MSNSHIPIVNESSQNNLNFPPELLPNGIPNSVSKLNEKKEEKNIESPNISQATKSLGRRFSITQLTDLKMLFLSNYLKNEQNLEDEHLTEEYFNTVFIDEMISTLFVALSLGSGIIYYETRTCSEKNVMNLVILIK